MLHENQVFGPVPGDVQDKYAPYIGSFEIILNKMLGSSGRDYLETMLHKKHIHQLHGIIINEWCYV